jgi:hypothetical protein
MEKNVDDNNLTSTTTATINVATTSNGQQQQHQLQSKQIHDSDVQEIINMMKEDLNLVKNNSKRDEASLNDPESPKCNYKTYDNEGTFAYESGSKDIISSTNSEISKDTSDYIIKNSDCNETEEEEAEMHTLNYYSSLNENHKNYTEITQQADGLPKEQNYYESVNDYNKNQQATLSNLPTYDEDYYNEFKQDETEPSYVELVSFVEKAKEFGANALDLSKKGLTHIPKALLELHNLQVRFFSFLLF